MYMFMLIKLSTKKRDVKVYFEQSIWLFYIFLYVGSGTLKKMSLDVNTVRSCSQNRKSSSIGNIIFSLNAHLLTVIYMGIV